MAINDLFSTEEKINSIQDFKDNTFNNSAMLMMVTDKKMMQELLKILKTP